MRVYFSIFINVNRWGFGSYFDQPAQSSLCHPSGGGEYHVFNCDIRQTEIQDLQKFKCTYQTVNSLFK